MQHSNPEYYFKLTINHLIITFFKLEFLYSNYLNFKYAEIKFNYQFLNFYLK